jgi:3-hydroxyisobutyrate dehydrogenase
VLAIARGHVWLGEAGLGTRLKLAVNSWILCTMENLAETLVLAETLEVDPRSFLEVISGGVKDMPYAHDEDMSAVDYVCATSAGARS